MQDRTDAADTSMAPAGVLAWLRSSLFVLWMTVTVVPYAIAALLLSLVVPRHRVYDFCQGWVRMTVWGCQVICGVRTRVHGRENLPQEPVIVLAKHQSAWETFALPVLLPRRVSYVFKRELLWIPFFGWVLGRLDNVHINRSEGARAFAKVAAQGSRLLARGNWIILFPEGTRTERGARSAYKHGGARLAVQTGAAVLPVAVTSARCWPRRSFIIRPGVIDVAIGPLIPAAGRHPAEVTADVQAWIEGEMHRLDPQAYTDAA